MPGSTVLLIPVEKIKSKWYTDMRTQFQPEMKYIQFLEKEIRDKKYISPIVVVKEGEDYFIVNGHHRFYAHLITGQAQIKCILIEGTFEQSEPLRKAEVLLKEYDQKTQYKYQFSGYLDRWAASAEEHEFINKYRPTYSFRIHKFLKKIINKFK